MYDLFLFRGFNWNWGKEVEAEFCGMEKQGLLSDLGSEG
jgi:hypothetical protein